MIYDWIQNDDPVEMRKTEISPRDDEELKPPGDRRQPPVMWVMPHQAEGATEHRRRGVRLRDESAN